MYGDYCICCVSCTGVVLKCLLTCGWVCVCVGFVMCGCVCAGFVMCGCFDSMCTCIYCGFIVCIVFFVLLRLCIFILICFVCTSVRTTATE